MNYIYDIVLNFNKEYYSFYEWNRKDNIINVKKIPLFLVDNECFNIMKYDMLSCNLSDNDGNDVIYYLISINY